MSHNIIDDEKHGSGDLWSMGLFDGNPDSAVARQQANERSQRMILRGVMVLMFCVVFAFCRYWLI